MQSHQDTIAIEISEKPIDKEKDIPSYSDKSSDNEPPCADFYEIPAKLVSVEKLFPLPLVSGILFKMLDAIEDELNKMAIISSHYPEEIKSKFNTSLSIFYFIIGINAIIFGIIDFIKKDGNQLFNSVVISNLCMLLSYKYQKEIKREAKLDDLKQEDHKVYDAFIKKLEILKGDFRDAALKILNHHRIVDDANSYDGYSVNRAVLNAVTEIENDIKWLDMILSILKTDTLTLKEMNKKVEYVRDFFSYSHLEKFGHFATHLQQDAIKRKDKKETERILCASHK